MSFEIDFWYWWVAGLIFITLEVFAPGAVFLWMGVAAGVVGALVYFMPNMAWEAQFIVFAVLSVITVVAWRMHLNKHPISTDQPTLNRRGEQYVGRSFTLEEAIVNGTGKICVDDSTWKITGEDCEKGTTVKVTGVDGVVLKVEH